MNVQGSGRHDAFQCVIGGIDPLFEFFGVEPTDRVLDNDEPRLHLAGQRLRTHQRFEGVRCDEVGRDAALFEFDAVVETPR